MTTRTTFRFLAAAAALVAAFQFGSALASPLGDTYTLTGANFPLDYTGAGPLTFDGVSEVVPGGGLTVVEGFSAGTGAHGGDVLNFLFTFTSGPNDFNGKFGFVIGGIDFGGTGAWGVLGAAIGIDFGVSNIPFPTDISGLGLLTGSFSSGLDLTFLSPASWSDIFAATNPPAGSQPTQIVFALSVEVQQIPEPATLPLLALGIVAMILGGRAAKARPSSRGTLAG